MLEQLKKFDAVDDINDIAELQHMVREAAISIRQIMAERDKWKQRHDDATHDIVQIREVSLDELVHLVMKQNDGSAPSPSAGKHPT